MPLIIITGYPSGGKTRRAEELKKLLQQKIQTSENKQIQNMNVELINDENLAIEKESYREARTEKATRAAQMSAVKRTLSKNTIVIFDNLSYIKGFRYQLFCEAKALSTNCCVVNTGAPVEKCREWNKARGSEGWPEDLFDSLVFRYEEPNGMNRWDSPLFTVAYDDPAVPVDDIFETLVLQKAKPPNHATVLKSAAPTNYVFELDRITQEIVSKVVEIQKLNPGGSVQIQSDIPLLDLPYQPVSIAQLQRIRRNFISLNKVKSIDTGRIAVMFLEFLQKNFDKL